MHLVGLIYSNEFPYSEVKNGKQKSRLSSCRIFVEKKCEGKRKLGILQRR